MSYLGFPLLRALSVIPLRTITLDELGAAYFRQSPDLTEAKLLDTFSYEDKGIQYEQRVYRLKDNSIYVETDQNTEVSIRFLESELKQAVVNQNFELAAKLRDKINDLKSTL